MELRGLAMLYLACSVGTDTKNIPEVVLASTFSADYTVSPYAYASVPITSTRPFQPKRKFGTRLHADSGGDAAHRAFHHGERQKNHAVGLGNVMRAGFVAFDVIWIIRGG